MKRNIIVFIAASLDGYIASSDDRLDWLFRIQGEGDNGYTEFRLFVKCRGNDWQPEEYEP